MASSLNVTDMVTKRWVGRWTNHNAQRKPPPNVSHTMYHSHTQCITYTCITHSTQNVSHTSHNRYHTYVSHTHKMYNTCTTQKITTQLRLRNSDYMTPFCPAPPSGRDTQRLTSNCLPCPAGQKTWRSAPLGTGQCRS